MESRKNGNSETSSEENGQSSSPDKSNDESAGTGRSYECTFCKRGFTNAQALGGHMNIHRKDKAKAKAEKNSTKSNKKDYMIMNNNVPSSYFTAVSSDVQGNHHHSSSLEAQMNYQSYFPPSNPSYPQGYNCYYASGYYAHQRTDHFGEYEDDLGANLSLRIGATEMEGGSKGKERDGKENWLENDVDLELRLGYHP